MNNRVSYIKYIKQSSSGGLSQTARETDNGPAWTTKQQNKQQINTWLLTRCDICSTNMQDVLIATALLIQHVQSCNVAICRHFRTAIRCIWVLFHLTGVLNDVINYRLEHLVEFLSVVFDYWRNEMELFWNCGKERDLLGLVVVDNKRSATLNASEFIVTIFPDPNFVHYTWHLKGISELQS